ncbi:MAG: hypothetical protein LBL47_03945, partial [Lactobacillus sp.]|nr:hypothetical protein [Lactobacillus sp.]
KSLKEENKKLKKQVEGIDDKIARMVDEKLKNMGKNGQTSNINQPRGKPSGNAGSGKGGR